MNRSRQFAQPPTRVSVRPLWLACLMLGVLVLGTGAAGSSAPESLVTGRELVLSAPGFATGSHAGTNVTAEGLSLLADSGTYVSAEITAPIAFTDVGALWILDQPPGSHAWLELRTSPDGTRWTAWNAVDPEEDLRRPDDEDTMGSLTAVPRSDGVHRAVQFRWHLVAAPNGEKPVLRRLRLAFIDASRAPISPAPDTLLNLDGSIDAYAKPAVVSRTAWGCPDGQESPEWPPEYYPVSHVIVHHTVSDTSVLSIWYYHAITRGWGDIGYNYLVDRNGVLYEGRAGGDDVVAGHAYPFNVGTLGVSFIGDYRTQPVPQVMIDNMADLLAWKADQKGIPPHGWAWLRPQTYPADPDRWLPRFMGHRDVSQTECPGDVLYAQIPLLRDEVASRLDSLNYQFADELNPAVFEKSNANWYDGPTNCGYDGHAYWTFSTTDPNLSTNWGRWRPNLPESGAYRVYAYVPYCLNGYPDSSGVYYQIHHAGGDTTVTVNQEAAAGGWADLGVFNFSAGTAGYVFLKDLAIDTNRTVWFDTIKWFREVDGGVTLPPTNLAPANGLWSTNRTVAFRWSASPSDGVDHYWIRIAADPSLTTIIKSDLVDYANQNYYYSFAADYPAVYWGVQAHGPNGYSSTSGPWSLGVDSVVPTSAVQYVLTYPDGRYSIHWRGTDATSGIAGFDVEYRVGALGAWTRWLTGTSSQGEVFPYPITDVIYFRSRAIDRAGNVGTWDAGLMNTANAVLLDHMVWLALASN
jgi:hypothetical protein